jgi:PAS domain S-box-containing protein
VPKSYRLAAWPRWPSSRRRAPVPLNDEARQSGVGPLGKRERPLAWHVAVLCLAIVLPILGLAGVLVWFDTAAERVRIEQGALKAAREVISASDRELAGLAATAEVLSLSRRLQKGDLDGFDEQARDVYRLLGINVVLRDRESHELVNTHLPRGAPLPTNVDAESDQLALQTKRPVVSNLFIGGVTRKPLFIVNVPVVRGGEVSYFLNLSLEPERIRDLILQIDQPLGWAVAVADQRGFVVAHSNSQKAMVGQRLPDSIWGEGKDRQGVMRGDDPADNHVPALIAFSRSEFSGWTAVATVPADKVSAPLRHSLVALFGIGTAILALSMCLAFVLSRRIEGAVGALAVEAARLGRGEAVQQLATPVREVNALSLALSEASREQQAAEAAFRSSEERLHLAQAAGRIGIWDWDSKSGHLICSPIYCQLYGLEPKGPGHQSPEAWLAQVHPDDRERVIRVRQAALASGRLEDEYRIVQPDGSVRWIVDRGGPIFDVEGRLSRFIGANVDVTERREAAERVRELQFELLHAARLTAMGQMAASFAHELNQPLGAATNFLGAARLALEAAGPDAPARALARIEKAAKQTVRAGAILRRLRDFIRRGETEKHIVGTRQLVEDAVALALVGVRDPKLRIRFDFDPEEHAIIVDRVQIQQVVFNLVRNALEATETCDPREIVLTTRPAGEAEVEISVADTGPGVPADPEALFKPFASSKPKGMGVGLSICRAIVEAHHGRLWAEPRAGGGAVFRFVVPGAQKTEAIDG